MGTVTERERERETENREIYPRSLIQTIFHEKKKKEEIESGRSLSNPFQPFILVTFDRRSFQDFHFDFVPFLFHFVIRLEIDRIFSVHSLFSSSLSLSFPLSSFLQAASHYSSERHSVSPFQNPIGTIVLPRFIVPFRYPRAAFSNFTHQWWNSIRGWNNSRRATNVLRLVSSFRGGRGAWRNIEEFFFSPLLFPPCYSRIFLPSQCLPFEYFKLFEVLYRRGGNIIRDNVSSRNFEAH